MDSRFKARQSYWEASQSRRVREAFARHQLIDVLHWAASAGEIARMPSDELDGFLDGLRDRVSSVDPAWAPAMDALRDVPAKTLRVELAWAFATLRECARALATHQGTATVRMTVGIYALGQAWDRDGRPRWTLSGRLADAIVWMGLKLLTEVDRSLIRLCAINGCERVYVAIKNQRYCPDHQREAQRQTQRRAERAFRERQRAAKTKRRRKA